MGGLAGQVPEGRGRPLSSAEIQKEREREAKPSKDRGFWVCQAVHEGSAHQRQRESRPLCPAEEEERERERERESPLAVKPLIQGALAHSYDCPSWLRGRREREEEAFRFTGAFAKRNQKEISRCRYVHAEDSKQCRPTQTKSRQSPPLVRWCLLYL